MPKARITLLDGTVIEDATGLAVQPAVLHYDQGSKPLDQVRQIEVSTAEDPVDPMAPPSVDSPAYRPPREGEIGVR